MSALLDSILPSAKEEARQYEEWADLRRDAAHARERMIAQYADVEPGPTNTYPPSWDAAAQLILFIRNPANFALNEYCKFRQAATMQGLYLVIDGDQAARIASEAEFDWADGSRRPEGQDQLLQFRFEPYICQRKDYPYTVGNLTRRQCPWPLEAAQAAMVMQQAMTLRTMRVMTLLELNTNWVSGSVTHYADANDLNDGSGPYDTADTTNYAIRKATNEVVLRINRDTNAMVRGRQLRRVLAPDLAKAMGESKEMADYVKNSVWAKETLQGKLAGENPNAEYNLPPIVYGVQVVVEDAVKVTSRKGATLAKSRVKAAASEVFCAVIDGLPGDQVGPVPVPNFSTFQIFHYDGLLKMMTWDDVRNERMEGHCTEIFTEKMVAPQSGFLVENCLSA